MRARNIKPSLFKNEELAKLGPWHVLLFEGLWCMADRKGRLEDRPERIEAEIFPFKFQKVNVEKCLQELAKSPEQFIMRYEKTGQRYIQVVNFSDHQYPHLREKESTIPAPNKHSASTSRARLNPDVLNPDVLNPESKTPSAPERRAATPFWQPLLQHINGTWTAKKRGAKYLWSGKDFSHLKRAAALYQAWEIMALWDDYLKSEDQWVKDHGYDIPTFVSQIPRLVDDFTWKTRSQKYQAILEEPLPKEVLTLVSNMGREITK